MRRHLDWLRQAEKDLAFAERALGTEDYEWASFAAHQAAEKAVKALLQHHGIDAWGHSVAFLLRGLPEEERPPEELLEGVKELDRHYIPTRYPDAHPGGAPMDYYTARDAQRAIALAAEVVRFARDKIQAP